MPGLLRNTAAIYAGYGGIVASLTKIVMSTIDTSFGVRALSKHAFGFGGIRVTDTSNTKGLNLQGGKGGRGRSSLIGRGSFFDLSKKGTAIRGRMWGQQASGLMRSIGIGGKTANLAGSIGKAIGQAGPFIAIGLAIA
jgi:hypothetical protein